MLSIIVAYFGLNSPGACAHILSIEILRNPTSSIRNAFFITFTCRVSGQMTIRTEARAEGDFSYAYNKKVISPPLIFSPNFTIPFIPSPHDVPHWSPMSG